MFIAAPPSWTVGDAIDHLRETEELPDRFFELYVVDDGGKLLGAVALDREQSPDDAPAPEPTAATEPAAATAVSPGGAPVGNAKTRTGKTRKTTDKPRR